jgi:hypothetical protein
MDHGHCSLVKNDHSETQLLANSMYEGEVEGSTYGYILLVKPM